MADTPFAADCGRCAAESSARMSARGDLIGSASFRMYLCPDCGSKRCPKAADHRNDCAATIAEGTTP